MFVRESARRQFFLGVSDDGEIRGVNRRIDRDIERNIANVTCNPNVFDPAPAFESERMPMRKCRIHSYWRMTFG